MLNGFKNRCAKFFASGKSGDARPIGVDFGTDSLKLAQVAMVDGEPKLIAAASIEVPGHVRHSVAARMAFFMESVRDLLLQGNFQGRQVVLALPAASMLIQHLRLPKMDDATLKKTLPWEVRGKLPIDPSAALLQHLIAGEVYHESESRNEIIVLAAARDLINQFLAAADKAKLDVVGMTVEPVAITTCFSHLHVRKEDAAAVTCYVDIGTNSSRAVIAQGSKILFARSIKVGAEHLTRAVANNLKINIDEARVLRLKSASAKVDVDLDESAVCTADDGDKSEDFSFGGRSSSTADFCEESGERGRSPSNNSPVSAAVTTERRARKINVDQVSTATVMEACHEPLTQMVTELNLCRRYFESTFPNLPVDRLIFIGGQANDRMICHHIAHELSLAAQVGDPMERLGRSAMISDESTFDPTRPQPAWAVAIGLSLGSAEK